MIYFVITIEDYDYKDYSTINQYFVQLKAFERVYKMIKILLPESLSYRVNVKEISKRVYDGF